MEMGWGVRAGQSRVWWLRCGTCRTESVGQGVE